MSCWLFHRWSKWTEPFPTEWVVMVQGKEFKTVRHGQQRLCERCGAVESRHFD
jgi:hypothetical protein